MNLPPGSRQGNHGFLAQSAYEQLTYHLGVGRETTAPPPVSSAEAKTYHLGVGRETTASSAALRTSASTYHLGVGRETTAPEAKSIKAC